MDQVAVSVEEFAECFGISTNTVYRLLDTGVLPELPRWSARRLIPRAVIDRIVADAMDGFDTEAVVHELGRAS